MNDFDEVDFDDHSEGRVNFWRGHQPRQQRELGQMLEVLRGRIEAVGGCVARGDFEAARVLVPTISSALDQLIKAIQHETTPTTRREVPL